MAPLQVILLLLLIKLPAFTPLGAQASSSAPATAHGVAIYASLWVWNIVLVLWVWRAARRAVRLMHASSGAASAILTGMERLLSNVRWITILLTGTYIYLLYIPDIIESWLAPTQLLRHIPLLPETAEVAPAILAWLGFWAAHYFVEDALRERTLPYRLAQALPAHEMPSLGRYLSMQIRHNFYLLIPLGGEILLEEAAERLQPTWPRLADVLAPAGLLLILLAIPWLITKVWQTQPLQGELRAKLDAIARENRLRFRETLLWNTHNAVTNAAILGFLPFARYFLMSDALVEALSDRQIEAVFSHEVGHGVHHHIWWYLAAFGGGLMAASGVTVLVQHVALVHHWHALTGDDAGFLLVMGLLAIFLGLMFPWVMHRFEHQADWFATRQIGRMIARQPAASSPFSVASGQMAVAVGGSSGGFLTTDSLTTDHSAGLTTDSLTTSHLVGAEVFASALDALIEITHRTRTRAGWMHPSINSRIALVRQMATDPGAAAAFNRRMFRTRLCIALFILAATALALWTSLAHF